MVIQRAVWPIKAGKPLCRSSFGARFSNGEDKPLSREADVVLYWAYTVYTIHFGSHFTVAFFTSTAKL